MHAELIKAVVLVSCPCDVAAFRSHMARQQWNPLWLLPVRAVSSIFTLPQMSATMSVVAISGGKDQIAPEVYARDYVTAAQRHHVLHASYTSIPGEGHEILLSPKVAQFVTEIVRGSDYLISK